MLVIAINNYLVECIINVFKKQNYHMSLKSRKIFLFTILMLIITESIFLFLIRKGVYDFQIDFQNSTLNKELKLTYDMPSKLSLFILPIIALFFNLFFWIFARNRLFNKKDKSKYVKWPYIFLIILAITGFFYFLLPYVYDRDFLASGPKEALASKNLNNLLLKKYSQQILNFYEGYHIIKIGYMGVVSIISLMIIILVIYVCLIMKQFAIYAKSQKYLNKTIDSTKKNK